MVSHEVAGEVDGDGRYVDPVIVESSAGKPHRTTSTATGQLEGDSVRR
jgi:hypothetical protein